MIKQMSKPGKETASNVTLANQYLPVDVLRIAEAAIESGLLFDIFPPGTEFNSPNLLSNGVTKVPVKVGHFGIVVEEGDLEQSTSFWKLKSSLPRK